MSLNLDRSGWKRVTLGDVIKHVTDRVDAETSGLKRFLAGEHIPSEDLQIREWGEVGRDPIGPMFYKRFRPGHALYVSRRAYLRKTAVPEFEGICGEKTFVLETLDPGVLIQGFLPFVLSAERFHSYAIAMSRGSVNPYVNWTDLKRYEFDLPPLDEQKRLADLLWAVEQHRIAEREAGMRIQEVRTSWLHSIFAEAEQADEFVALNSLIASDRPICYGVLMPGPEFVDGRLIVDVKDYPAGAINLAQVRRCDPEIEASFARSRLRTGDVLLSIRGTIGRVAVVPEQLDGHNISRDSARLSGDPEKVLPEFLRLILESPDVQAEIRRTTTGLAVKGINVARIRNLRVPQWDLVRQQDAVSRLRDIEKSRVSTEAAVASLDDLRRSILANIFGEAA